MNKNQNITTQICDKQLSPSLTSRQKAEYDLDFAGIQNKLTTAEVLLIHAYITLLAVICQDNVN